jgi:hypothetical protein
MKSEPIAPASHFQPAAMVQPLHSVVPTGAQRGKRSRGMCCSSPR